MVSWKVPSAQMASHCEEALAPRLVMLMAIPMLHQIAIALRTTLTVPVASVHATTVPVATVHAATVVSVL